MNSRDLIYTKFPLSTILYTHYSSTRYELKLTYYSDIRLRKEKRNGLNVLVSNSFVDLKPYDFNKDDTNTIKYLQYFKNLKLRLEAIKGVNTPIRKSILFYGYIFLCTSKQKDICQKN
jgi:hypothetical protein